MATDENNHKNEARDDWTGCTFRVERGPSSEGRAWGMADILTDARGRVSGRASRPAAPTRDPTRVTRPRRLGPRGLRTSWTSSFVLLFPARPHVGAGRPVGSTPLRVRTVFFFEAVMFLLH